jgi:hypothetical protein
VASTADGFLDARDGGSPADEVPGVTQRKETLPKFLTNPVEFAAGFLKHTLTRHASPLADAVRREFGWPVERCPMGQEFDRRIERPGTVESIAQG